MKRSRAEAKLEASALSAAASGLERQTLTPTLRALILAERALEGCTWDWPERAQALAAIRSVLGGEGLSRSDPAQRAP